jgi:murein DD-endopeptidase MepM/ murein hydrolase activator NlpD
METLKGEPRFPLRVKPRWNRWKHKGTGTSFNASRGDGRLHAGCDLHVPQDTDVVAVADGEVIDILDKKFKNKTSALQVQHDGFIILYGEVFPVEDDEGNPGVVKGKPVFRGDTIAKVANQGNESQLHFELYLKKDNTPQNVLLPKGTRRPPYDRKLKPRDPTPYLKQWENALTSKS